MAISDRINEMYTHVGDVYDTITNVDLPTNKNIQNIPSTMRNSYLEIMNNGIDKIWNNWEKVEGTGETLTLNSTEEAPMKNVLNGNTYQSTTILPSEYTQVEYIESTGTQYIDTGVNTDNNMSIDIDYQFTLQGTASYENCFGVINSDGAYLRYHFETRTANSLSFSYYHNNVINIYEGFYTDRFRTFVDMPNLKCQTWKNGVSQLNIDLQDFGDWDSQLNFWLFRRNSNNTSLQYFSKNRIYHCKMYASGVLVRDFIPCYRNSDNVIGLYDYVNKVFYINQGTGTFTKGNNVITPTSDFPTPSPEYPQDIHVVSGDNTIKVEGKNLLKLPDNIRTFNGGVNVETSNNTKFTFTGTAAAAYYNSFALNYHLPKGTYTMSSTNNNFKYYFWFRDKNNVTTYANVHLNNSSRTFILEEDAETIIVGVEGLTSGTTYNIETYFQLEKGDSATSYEPFNGDTYNVSLPIKNLFDSSLFTNRTVQGITLTKNSDGTITLNGTSTARADFTIIDLFSLKGDNKIASIFKKGGTTTGNVTFGIYDSNWANGKQCNITSSSDIGNASLPSGITLTKCFIRIESGITLSNLTIALQIEQGSKTNSYTPYGTTPIELCDFNTYKDYFIRTEGKNLCGTTFELGGIDTTTGQNGTGTDRVRTKDYVEIKPNTAYTLSGVQGSRVVCFYNFSKAYLSYAVVGSQSTSGTFTTPNDTSYIRWYIIQTNTNIYEMLNEGSIALPYQPYGSGEWYKCNQLSKYVLDGTQNIPLASSTPRRFNASYTTLGITNTKDGASATETQANYRMCDHFSYTSGNTTWGNYYLHNNWLVILDSESVIADANALKTWLSNNNTIIYYVLATPTYTKITYEPLLEQLETFYNAKSKNNQTNITQENNDLPFILDVTALKQLTQ